MPDEKAGQHLLRVDSQATAGYLVSQQANGKCLMQAIAAGGQPQGLILVTGSTGSGKTSFLNALVLQVLDAQLRRLSRHRLKISETSSGASGRRPFPAPLRVSARRKDFHPC